MASLHNEQISRFCFIFSKMITIAQVEALLYSIQGSSSSRLWGGPPSITAFPLGLAEICGGEACAAPDGHAAGVSCSVVSSSVTARLLSPRDSPGKNTGVGCHFLLQGVVRTQGSNPGLLHCRQILYHLSH